MSTRDAVLHAAIRLLLAEGPNGLTLERVAREAAVSKGGLLYHFTGKEQLIEGLVELATAHLRGERTLASQEMGVILLVAAATGPDLLHPLRLRFRERPASLRNLVEEALWLRDSLDLNPPAPAERQAVQLQLTEGNQTMREESFYAVPGPAAHTLAEIVGSAVERRELRGPVRSSVARSSESLLALQSHEGFWQGRLTADTTLESDYILLTYWLHRSGDWNSQLYPRVQKASRTILDRQLPDGGWNIYPGGPSEVNATIRAHVALRIAGCLQVPERSRDRILALGGLQAANSYTKINLSLAGLFPRQFVPTVPPEITLAPGNLLYEMSSWSRTIIVPLSIVQALGVERAAPAGVTVDDLYLPGVKLALPGRDKMSTVFNQVDRFLKLWERRGLKEVRAKAIREAERWMVEHMRHSDGIGAIYPSMMYSLMAMDALGYERDQPDFLETQSQFEGLMLESPERLEFQPSLSPVWDTAISLFAAGEAGAGNPESAQKAADWLLSREVRRRGDWSVKRPNLQPGGWAFEFSNDFYPDIDDTAMVLLALEHARASDPAKQEKAERRAIDWLLGMQSTDGGWAAFDVDNNWQVLSKVPFADHNAMLDPTCPDITGRVMEALCRRGHADSPAIAKAVDYLLRQQKPDGSWYGRWGVNYVYGTFLALRGLRAAGVPKAGAATRKAADWLASVRNQDGGWGEHCSSYEVHSFVRAESTPSQTAWALLGLEAAGVAADHSVCHGLRWLTERQNENGSWDESLMTGTGFPNVFYLNYRLYPHYFPLLALGVWEKRLR